MISANGLKNDTASAARQPQPLESLRTRSSPRLPRISSDWEPSDDNISRSSSIYKDIRDEFEHSHKWIGKGRSTVSRPTSHHGFFRAQTADGRRISIPVDPEAHPDAYVVVDKASSTIFDVYLLQSNIMKNVNRFRRHQVWQRDKLKSVACTLTRCSGVDCFQPRV